MATPWDKTNAIDEGMRPFDLVNVDERRSLYGRAFHAPWQERTLVGARHILRLLGQVWQYRSVIDVGCGIGTWLVVAREFGARHLVGVEGRWLSREDIADLGIDVHFHDLERPLRMPARFDLAICLEVAEHLSPERASGFIADLVRLAPAVLFSAAIPGQGGTDHRNERWPSYWAGLFADHAFQPFDVIRPQIWMNEQIPVWYRQNMVFYVHKHEITRVRSITAAEPMSALDIVHPVLLENAIQRIEHPSFKDSLRSTLHVPSALGRAIRRRLWRAADS